MTRHVVLLSIPGLREKDLACMPQLSRRMAGGQKADLNASFPAVTWPVQANMLTGVLPCQHGVVANGFYWRERQEVEMWTAWNDKIEAPQIWDRLHERDSGITSAVWFPMLSKGCGADYICMPAPIHNPDGSEDLWCYTKPTELYGTLRDQLGHFPLQNFWGPLAGIQSSAWIAESALLAAQQYRPRFFFVYLPQLDYAAQKHGPDSPAADLAVKQLDEVLGKLVDGVDAALGDDVLWMAASEYVITPVDHVAYPNRLLRDAGLLKVRLADDGEHLDLIQSEAWAMTDHQMSHVFVRDSESRQVDRIAALFRSVEGIAEVLQGDELQRYGLNHPRSGDVVLISEANSWQAYYWWLEDSKAPGFARTVDIHRKPGYDPVELHFDATTRSIPLDATLVQGSHGAPVRDTWQRGVLMASEPAVLPSAALSDTDIANVVLAQF